MRTKLLAIFLAAVAIGAVSIGGVLSKNRSDHARTVLGKVGSTRPFTQNTANNASPADQSGAVDGASNPELIPDHVAYLLLFRFVAGRNTDAERNRIRDYLRFAGLGCQTCNAQASSTSTDDAEIDSLIAAAEEAEETVTILRNAATRVRRILITETS